MKWWLIWTFAYLICVFSLQSHTLRSAHQCKLCSSFIGAERSDYGLCNARQSTIKFNKFKCVLGFYAHIIWISSTLPPPSPSSLLSSSPSASHAHTPNVCTCLISRCQAQRSVWSLSYVVGRLANGISLMVSSSCFVNSSFISIFTYLGFPSFNVYCLCLSVLSDLVQRMHCNVRHHRRTSVCF